MSLISTVCIWAFWGKVPQYTLLEKWYSYGHKITNFCWYELDQFIEHIVNDKFNSSPCISEKQNKICHHDHVISNAAHPHYYGDLPLYAFPQYTYMFMESEHFFSRLFLQIEAFEWVTWCMSNYCCYAQNNTWLNTALSMIMFVKPAIFYHQEI